MTANTDLKDPSLEWSMQTARGTWSHCFTIYAVVSIVNAVIYSFVRETLIEVVVVLWITSIVLATAGVVGVKHIQDLWKIEVVMVSILSILCACNCIGHIFLDSDVIERQRGLMSTMLWSSIPIIMNMRFLMSTVFQLWCVCCQITALGLAGIYHGDDFTLGLTAYIVIVNVCFYLAGLLQRGRLSSIYKLQLTAESESIAKESVLTMMCDTFIWLAPRTFQVTQSSARFDAIIGKPMLSQCLSECYNGHEDEWDRVQESLSGLNDTRMLLHSSLATAASPHLVEVEKFVAKAEATEESALLVGIRLHNERLSMQHGSAEAFRLSAFSFAKMSRESLPESKTYTEHIFRTLDLAQVADLGVIEHWCIPPSDIKVDTENVLGRGGFGVVCSGSLYGLPVAVKFPHLQQAKEDLVSSINELRNFRTLRHPNIVLFHGAVVREDGIAIVMELLVGETLKAFIPSRTLERSLATHDRYRIILDTCCALWYLHARSTPMVHGDLNYSNIMVEARASNPSATSGNYRARLIDFGLARIISRHAEPCGGNFAWMAPELLQGPKVVPQHSCDVFSFGRISFFVLTGLKPCNLPQNEVIELAKLGRLPPLPPVSVVTPDPTCMDLCERCLRVDANSRPHISEVYEDVIRWPASSERGRETLPL